MKNWLFSWRLGGMGRFECQATGSALTGILDLIRNRPWIGLKPVEDSG